MLQTRDLRKTYTDPDGNTIAAADGVNLSCRAGEVYALLGPNGAGKTTTLRCLATVLTPTSGSATIDGHDLVSSPQLVRQSIGFLSGTTGLYGRLTPRETLLFFGSLYGLAGDFLRERVETTLKAFAISEYADRPTDRLSTGMKQRVGLARAVVHDPPVVILDEPTTGLDPVVSKTVEDSIRELAARGKCVLLSTHMMYQAEDLAARVGIMGRGRVLMEGTPAELCESLRVKNLREVFFSLIAADGSPRGIPAAEIAGGVK